MHFSLRPHMVALSLFLCMTVSPISIRAQSAATVGVAVLEHSGGSTLSAVSDTVRDTVITVLSMTGQFDPRRLGQGYSASAELLREVSDEAGLDNIITGTVETAGSGETRISLAVYNRREDAVTVRVRENAETLFSVFDAVDRVVIALLEGLTGEPVTFGSIIVDGDWRPGTDQLFLDGRPYEVRGGRVSSVLVREYEVSLIRDGTGEIVRRTVAVPPDGQARLTVPLLELSLGAIDLVRQELPQAQRVFVDGAGSDLTVPGDGDAQAASPGDRITLGQDLSGTTLRVYRLRDVYRPVVDEFSRRTGIEVVTIPTEEQEWRLDVALARSEPPELAVIAQPGVVFDLLALGLTEDTYRALDRDLLVERYREDILAFTERDGGSAGLVTELALKSMYWYVPEWFDDRELSVPQNGSELAQLEDELIARGEVPYAFAIESGPAATGWPFTDWVEDRVLQRAGPQQYDGWVRGDLQFGQSPVNDIITELVFALRREEYVAGGPQTVVNTPFHRSLEALTTESPEAAMVFGSSFLAGWYEDDLDRLDFFPTPPEDDDTGETHRMVGGEVMTVVSASPAARAFLRFLSGGDGAEILARSLPPGWVVAQKSHRPEWYSPFGQKVARVIHEADVLRFDGSDSMSLGRGMQSFVPAGRSLMNGAAIRGILRDIDEQRRSVP
jgi:alpha-glucoside transport system substrate-binding protein